MAPYQASRALDIDLRALDADPNDVANAPQYLELTRTSRQVRALLRSLDHRLSELNTLAPDESYSLTRSSRY